MYGYIRVGDTFPYGVAGSDIKLLKVKDDVTVRKRYAREVGHPRSLYKQEKELRRENFRESD